MDALVALSEQGINQVVQKELQTLHFSKSDEETWGPFSAGYTVSVALSGGTVELVENPVQLIRIKDLTVTGSAGVNVGFDLNDILPHICIPPWQACVHIPFLGTICTPQVCITWPSLTIPINIPIGIGFSADFGIAVQDGGATWNIVLLVYPLSLTIDSKPIVDAIFSAVETAVNNALNDIPLIGGLIADLVDTVLGALNSVVDLMAQALDDLIHEAVLLLDIFSPTIPFVLFKVTKSQVWLPATGPDDPDVSLFISALTADIADHEFIVKGAIA